MTHLPCVVNFKWSTSAVSFPITEALFRCFRPNHGGYIPSLTSFGQLWHSSSFSSEALLTRPALARVRGGHLRSTGTLGAEDRHPTGAQEGEWGALEVGRVALPRPPQQWAEDEVKNPLLLVSSGVWWCASGCNLEIENHVAPATFLLFSDCVWCSEGNFMQAFSVEEPHRALFKSNYMWYTDFFIDIWFNVWTIFIGPESDHWQCLSLTP